jgi:uncharacterized protein YdeI (BOF family)
MHPFRYRLSALALLAVPTLAGCTAQPQHLLGAALPTAAPISVRAISTRDGAAPVVVEGEMIEKCPVAGCWFMLKDKTGVVRVDTKGAGFVVSEVPLHARLTVAGIPTPGAQPGLAATGVRY